MPMYQTTCFPSRSQTPQQWLHTCRPICWAHNSGTDTCADFRHNCSFSTPSPISPVSCPICFVAEGCARPDIGGWAPIFLHILFEIAASQWSLLIDLGHIACTASLFVADLPFILGTRIFEVAAMLPSFAVLTAFGWIGARKILGCAGAAASGLHSSGASSSTAGRERWWSR
jgi:hypothetical protein